VPRFAVMLHFSQAGNEPATRLTTSIQTQSCFGGGLKAQGGSTEDSCGGNAGAGPDVE